MTKTLMPFLAILLHGIAAADGGKVQLRQETGNLVITVFSAPASLAVGSVDMSVLVQNRAGLEPILDASVWLFLYQDTSSIKLEAHPTRLQAQNKLLYAAPVTLSEPGRWRMEVVVTRGGKTNQAATIFEVAPAPAKTASYAAYIGLPPVAVILFVMRERLIRRKTRG